MNKTRIFWIGLIVVTFTAGIIYLQTQARTIYGGDAGDLVSAIITSGIAHPPGYPLYTALGIDLITLIPFDTYAYRVGFLSSIPTLFALIAMYVLLSAVTHKYWLSAIAVLSLALVYPIWLYASVVEVFGGSALFIASLLCASVLFTVTRRRKFLFLTSYMFGLSLTHHHIILFLVPALFYLIKGSHAHITRKHLFQCVCLFILGLVPYAYTMIAAFYNPAINWQAEPTMSNFFQLVTRASYGTFQAGGFIAHEPILRLVDLWAFFDFLYKDFRLAGVILMIVGGIYAFRKNRQISIAFAIGIASYLFFIFYASFPLVENFLVGTFERFVQPLYILLIYFLVYGLYAFEDGLNYVGRRIIANRNLRLVVVNMSVLFIILPLGLFLLNYPKIYPLKNDFTAENLGRDILNSVEPKSIIIMSTDTPLFNTQYVYFSENKWPDVILIHFQKLFTPSYYRQLSKFHPNVHNLDQKSTSAGSFQTFLDNNYRQFPIYSKVAITAENGAWITHGLLFRYFKENDIPAIKQTAGINDQLWRSYHDPLEGALAFYKHLLLSDVLSIYGIARQETGYYLARSGYVSEAEAHLIAAEKLFPQDSDSYKILAQVYITQKQCQKAEEQLEQLKKRKPDDSGYYYIASLNYAACWKDEAKAVYFQNLYEQKELNRKTPLEKL